MSKVKSELRRAEWFTELDHRLDLAHADTLTLEAELDKIEAMLDPRRHGVKKWQRRVLKKQKAFLQQLASRARKRDKAVAHARHQADLARAFERAIFEVLPRDQATQIKLRAEQIRADGESEAKMIERKPLEMLF